MEGWVDLGYPAMHRQGVKLAIFRSQVRRPNHYTPSHPWNSLFSSPLSFAVVSKSSRERVLINLELRDGLVLIGSHRNELRLRKHVTGHMTGHVTGHVTAGRWSLVFVAALVVLWRHHQGRADVIGRHHEHSRTILPQRTHDYLNEYP